MRGAGGAAVRDWTDAAGVVGLWEVIRRYGFFRREFAETLAEIRSANPSAIVLIDYPGFNLRLARALRRQSPDAKIIYYISPQVWAWNRARIPRMAQWLDLMLCIFPFEAELYNRSGLRTVFVGHPLLENPQRRADDAGRDLNLVAIFPGSRAREVRKILPVMLDAASKILAARPATRFEIAAASEPLAEEISRVLDARKKFRDRFMIRHAAAREIMRTAGAGMVASGTATLEAAAARLPFVLVYKVSWLTYFAARAVVKVKFLGMPNVLAGKQIVPEFIQHRAQSAPLAAEIIRLLDDKSARTKMLAEFESVIAQLGAGQASAVAASAILRELPSA